MKYTLHEYDYRFSLVLVYTAVTTNKMTTERKKTEGTASVNLLV